MASRQTGDGAWHTRGGGIVWVNQAENDLSTSGILIPKKPE